MANTEQQVSMNDLYSLLQNMGGGPNPYVMGVQQFLQALGGLIDTPEKKFGRWQGGMAKQLGDDIRWDLMKKEAVSGNQVSNILGNLNRSMQPAFADMLYGASRHAGLSSPQTYGIYAQKRLPVMAGMRADLDKWRIGTNLNYQQNLRNLLASLVR